MERGRESGHGSYQPDRLAATRGATQPGEGREWKLISQPRHIFAHIGPSFMEAEIWVVPKARAEAAERRAREAEARVRWLCDLIDNQYTKQGQPSEMDFVKIGANEARQALDEVAPEG